MAQQQDERPVRYCLYARKSTEQDERQALSIGSQIKEMTDLAEKQNLNVVHTLRESHSAKASGNRPVFNEMMQEIQNGKYDGILTWAPDRLSRNAGDLGIVVDLMDEGILREIRTYGQTFTDSPNEKFLLMILGGQAKLENDNRSINVKRGLRAVVEKGLWPTTAPTGYLNDKRRDKKCHVLVDTKRAPVIKEMFCKVGEEGMSGREVWRWLKYEKDFRTTGGKHLTLSNVYRILKNSFYTGTFEYPRGSGNFYTGQHDPIISEKLFEKVQDQLSRNNIEKPWGIKEFAFTKLMKCGLCGSGITAMEKYKKLKDGDVKRYVYYACTKSRDKNCDAGYIREKDLVKQLTAIIEKVSLDKLGTQEKIKKEISRYRTFREDVLGMEKENVPYDRETDVRNYAKYILKEGSITEKRELLANMESKLVLVGKEVELQD